MDTTVHVICCNDSVEFAVVGDYAKAEAKLAAEKRQQEETKPDDAQSLATRG